MADDLADIRMLLVGIEERLTGRIEALEARFNLLDQVIASEFESLDKAYGSFNQAVAELRDHVLNLPMYGLKGKGK